MWPRLKNLFWDKVNEFFQLFGFMFFLSIATSHCLRVHLSMFQNIFIWSNSSPTSNSSNKRQFLMSSRLVERRKSLRLEIYDSWDVLMTPKKYTIPRLRPLRNVFHQWTCLFRITIALKWQKNMLQNSKSKIFLFGFLILQSKKNAMQFCNALISLYSTSQIPEKVFKFLS